MPHPRAAQKTKEEQTPPRNSQTPKSHYSPAKIPQPPAANQTATGSLPEQEPVILSLHAAACGDIGPEYFQSRVVTRYV
jgi:hypothetical protein